MATDFVVDEFGNATCNGFLNASGDAANPSITFSGDTDTGMWRPGVNTIAFSVNGSENVRFSSNRGVGINMDPGMRFDVTDNGLGQYAIRCTQTGTTSNNQVGIYSTISGATTTNTAFWATATAATTNYAFIAENGISGFLTTSPTANVDIETGGTANASLRLRSGAAPSSPNSGDIWHDSTRKALSARVDGMTQNLVGILFTATADATVANTTTETTIMGSGVGTKTLPADFLTVGKTVCVTVRGKYSDAVVPGTLTVKIKYGSTVLLTTGAQTPAGTLTNEGFEVIGIITCRTTGASGTVYSQGDVLSHTAATTSVVWEMTNTATTTIDTTASNAIDCTVTWGTADAANTITGTNVIIEALN